MIQNKRYLSSSLEFNERCLSKLRDFYDIPADITDSEIQETYKFLIWNFMDFMLADLKNDFASGGRMFFDKSLVNIDGQVLIVKALLANDHIYTYLVNQINTMFGKLFNDIAEDQWFKEIIDEKIAFYIKYNSENIESMTDWVTKIKDPSYAFNLFNEQLFRLRSNHNLLEKLPGKRSHIYFDFVSDAKDYLKDTAYQTPLKSEVFSSPPNNNVKTLEALFQEQRIYQQFLKFMIEKRLIGKNKDSLTWIGYRRGAKYEVGLLQEALAEAGFLKYKAENEAQLITISANTFNNFTATERTMRRKDDHGKFKKYRELLSEFKSILG